MSRAAREQLGQTRRLDVPAHRRVRPGLLDELDSSTPTHGVAAESRAVGLHALALPEKCARASARSSSRRDVERHVDRLEVTVAHEGPVVTFAVPASRSAG